MKINLYPKKCNLCGGKVEYISNAEIYGKKYGSGFCYHCTKCGAMVGTHKPRPKEALGLLADRRMKDGKMVCHELFDKHWKGKKSPSKTRGQLYQRLANEMNIPIGECHFGWFDLEQLIQAYKILKSWEEL